jgi:hypothetical protein
LHHTTICALFQRLLTLLAELMCISECSGRFPAMGKKCCTLAREVSMGMSQSAETFVQQACQLKPDWLALLVVHQAITKVIQPGNVGMPSLDLVVSSPKGSALRGFWMDRGFLLKE